MVPSQFNLNLNYRSRSEYNAAVEWKGMDEDVEESFGQQPTIIWGGDPQTQTQLQKRSLQPRVKECMCVCACVCVRVCARECKRE